ncbi:MAG: hypothetical protein Q7T03_06245, partial [Deltaproteobacteria bacterium]|nr:hypothetical protein [Deltaproteobacteria bacterium]
MKKIILSLFILFVSASAWAGIGLGHQDWYLTIDAAALDKEFLFMPTLVVDSTLKSKHPTTSYTPKIVYFRFLNGKIFLFEKMDPAKALEPYKPEKILAEFPVVKMREKSFIFDVKSGIEHFLLDGGDDKTVLVHSSYLRDFMETDSLFSFYHVIQSGDDPEKTMILNYAFRVNDKNVDFEIVPPDSKGRVGVFTASEGVAVHWDIRKPVVFHISANTPDAFFEAVKEGILMWNG